MNFQKIQIHRGDPVNLKNYDFIFTITLARIKILTSSFFLAFSLTDTLHLTPKTLKSETKKIWSYKGGPILQFCSALGL